MIHYIDENIGFLIKSISNPIEIRGSVILILREPDDIKGKSAVVKQFIPNKNIYLEFKRLMTKAPQLEKYFHSILFSIYVYYQKYPYSLSTFTLPNQLKSTFEAIMQSVKDKNQMELKTQIGNNANYALSILPYFLNKRQQAFAGELLSMLNTKQIKHLILNHVCKSKRLDDKGKIKLISWIQSFDHTNKPMIGISRATQYTQGLCISLIKSDVKIGLIKADNDLEFNTIDALIIPGGENIPQHYYEQGCPAQISTENPSDTDLEIMYLRKALDKGMPVWGVCRGNQLIAVEQGAKLIDVEGHGSNFEFDDDEDCSEAEIKGRQFKASAKVISKGKIADITGRENQEIATFSVHAQAAHPDTIPQSLRVSMISGDGVIKALELKSPFHSFVIGTQFHPESSYADASNRKIIDAFVNEAACFRARKNLGPDFPAKHYQLSRMSFLCELKAKFHTSTNQEEAASSSSNSVVL